MICRDCTDLLDAYVDGELDLKQSLAVEAHIDHCPGCRAGERRIRALRNAVRGSTELQSAPPQVLRRLNQHLDHPVAGAGRRRAALRMAAVGVGGFVAGALAAWTFVALDAQPVSRDGRRVVYHLSSSANAGAALRTLRNHLEASPDIKVVVVAHNEGIDFLLREARDENGEPFRTRVAAFHQRGVEFRVCANTLERRRIGTSAFIPEARFVPSGIAEISRLQSDEAYVYMRM